MGGPESPTIPLTIEDHAIAHRMLYEEFGKEEDRRAWLGLSGLMSKEDILKEIAKENGAMGKAALIAYNKTLPWLGREKTKEHRQKHSEANKLAWAEGRRKVDPSTNIMFLDNPSRALAAKEMECPHCGKAGRGQGMLRWHMGNCRHKGDKR